ncbi:MAG: GNAT family N-acetyltransferase [Alphaproteobacteria bacterium]
MTPAPEIQANVKLEIVQELSTSDLADLCLATEDAIKRGGGFGWLKTPARSKLEAYWRGFMMVPGRHLLLARLDGLIAGALQLHEAPKNLESQASIGKIQSGFTASWARGHGIGQALVQLAIKHAKFLNLTAIKLDVRETQTSAITIYRALGFHEWGRMPRYAFIDDAWVAGLYFYLDLIDDASLPRN